MQKQQILEFLNQIRLQCFMISKQQSLRQCFFIFRRNHLEKLLVCEFSRFSVLIDKQWQLVFGVRKTR